jgi:hypothetical protein
MPPEDAPTAETPIRGRPDPGMSRIVSFPLARCHSLVIDSADELLCLKGEDANIFWRRRMVELGSHLHRIGLTADSARKQLYSFHDAVQQELTRRSGQF